MREAYFHEDDYRQLELLRSDNTQWCLEQMRKIDDFASAHHADIGWTDIYLRPENPTLLSSLGMTRSEFTAVMPLSMRPFTRVLTGYGTCQTECPRTIAFGPSNSLVAYAQWAENDIVTAIWLTLDLTSTEDVAMATDLATALSRWNLSLADWGWSQLILLADSEALTQYFSARLKVFGQCDP